MARQTSWIVGSDLDCDVVVPHPNVSAKHCRLTRSPVGFHLEDLQSSNGTFVNGVRVMEPMAVSRQDRITLGRSVEMPWPGSTPVASDSEAAPSQRTHEAAQVTVTLRGNAMELGRDPQCDHVLDYPMVSWRHAHITRDGASLFVEDLNSSNGTFVALVLRRTLAVGVRRASEESDAQRGLSKSTPGTNQAERRYRGRLFPEGNRSQRCASKRRCSGDDARALRVVDPNGATFARRALNDRAATISHGESTITMSGQGQSV